MGWTPVNIPIEGLPIFFILFFYTFLIWVIDFKNIKEFYTRNKLLVFFYLFGLYYVLISFAGGFSLIYNIPYDTNYIFRQAYFIPFLAIAIPVFLVVLNLVFLNILSKIGFCY